jgi:hypothetical protein
MSILKGIRLQDNKIQKVEILEGCAPQDKPARVFESEKTVLMELAEQAEDSSGKAIYAGWTDVDRWLPGFREQNDIGVSGNDALVSLWLGNRT